MKFVFIAIGFALISVVSSVEMASAQGGKIKVDRGQVEALFQCYANCEKDDEGCLKQCERKFATRGGAWDCIKSCGKFLYDTYQDLSTVLNYEMVRDCIESCTTE